MADPLLSMEGSTLRFSGAITFATARGLLARGLELLPRLPPAVTMDLSGTTRVDSAGVAMLVEFWRLHRRSGGTLRLESVPEDLHPMLQLYGLEDLFGEDEPN